MRGVVRLGLEGMFAHIKDVQFAEISSCLLP